MSITNDEISNGAEWASDEENLAHFRAVTVDTSARVKPIENQLEPRLYQSYVDVATALVVFQHNVNAECENLLGRFRCWLDLTEQIHSATLGQSTHERGSE